MTMKKTLIVSIAALTLVCGCARFNSTVTERTLPDGIQERETRVSASTLFDSKSELAKLSTGQTDKSQKVTIGALNQESSATNAVNLVESVVGAAVRAAVKP
jgi:hypothetical protein